MFPQLIGDVEIYSKSIFWDWQKTMPHDLNTGVHNLLDLF